MWRQSASRWRVCEVTDELLSRLIVNDLRALLESTLDKTLGSLAVLRQLLPGLLIVGTKCIEAFRQGHKLIASGNGGKACEAQRLVWEVVGRYKSDGVSMPSLAIKCGLGGHHMDR